MTTTALHRQEPLTNFYAFTCEQVEEQKRFAVDLENGKADIMVEGSMLEITAFLNGLGQICGQMS